MQKLIKINTNHYIIVDDSEIQTGDWYYDTNDKESLMPIYQRSQDPKFYSGCKKITHSTQPLEEGATIHGVEHKRWVQIKYIDLDEVKELIGEVDEIEKIVNNDNYTQSFKVGFEHGYNQCLEDNKEKKYTEENMKFMFEAGYRKNNLIKSTFEGAIKFIQSLQPKTSWDVEIIDGQLKLK